MFAFIILIIFGDIGRAQSPSTELGFDISSVDYNQLKSLSNDIISLDPSQKLVIEEYVFNSILGFNTDQSIKISINFGLFNYVSSCKAKKCFIGYISKYSQGYLTIQGNSSTKEIPPIFLLAYNSESNYQILFRQQLGSSQRKIIFKIGQIANPFQSSQNKHVLKNDDQSELMSSVQKQVNKLNDNFINTANIDGELTFKTSLKNQTKDDKLMVKGKLTHIKTKNNCINLIQQLIRQLSTKTITYSRDQIINLFKNKISLKNLNDNVKQQKNLQLQKPKKGQIANAIFYSQDRRVLKVFLLSHQVSLQVKIECRYFLMSSGPSEIGCYASVYFILFGQKKELENIYNYRRPYNFNFRTTNLLKDKFLIQAEFIFPQHHYAKVKFTIETQYSVRLRNQIKNSQTNPVTFQVQNQIDIQVHVNSHAKVSHGIERGKPQYIQVLLRGRLMKCILQSKVKAFVKDARNMSYFINWRIISYKPIGQYKRQKTYLAAIFRRSFIFFIVPRQYYKTQCLYSQVIYTYPQVNEIRTNIVPIYF